MVAGGLGLAPAIGLALDLGGQDYVTNNIDDQVGQTGNGMDSSDTRPETRGSGGSVNGTEFDIGD